MKLRKWSIDDDQALVELIDDFVSNQQMTLNDALEEAAIVLDRTFIACQYRWHYCIKQHIAGSNLLTTIDKNNPSSASKYYVTNQKAPE